MIVEWFMVEVQSIGCCPSVQSWMELVNLFKMPLRKNWRRNLQYCTSVLRLKKLFSALKCQLPRLGMKLSGNLSTSGSCDECGGLCKKTFLNDTARVNCQYIDLLNTKLPTPKAQHKHHKNRTLQSRSLCIYLYHNNTYICMPFIHLISPIKPSQIPRLPHCLTIPTCLIVLISSEILLTKADAKFKNIFFFFFTFLVHETFPEKLSLRESIEKLPNRPNYFTFSLHRRATRFPR